MSLGCRTGVATCVLALSGAILSRFLPAWPAEQTLPAHVRFTNVAEKAGITTRIVNGGETTKKYVFESTGSGVAFLDYDHDGYPDIFLVNGSRLEGFAARTTPSNHLYHNNHDGTFTDVTAAARLARSGWGQGVCAGDYDNDGFDDLFVTYYGQPNALYHNNGDGTFTDVTANSGLGQSGRNWSTGCAFLDYDRDGKLDLFVAGYVDFDPASAPLPGSNPNCLWKGVAVFCGPRGLPTAKPHLYHNQGDGTFADVSFRAGILKAGDCYGLGVLTADFENSGWPGIYVACDSTPSLYFPNNTDGTFSSPPAMCIRNSRPTATPSPPTDSATCSITTRGTARLKTSRRSQDRDSSSGARDAASLLPIWITMATSTSSSTTRMTPLPCSATMAAIKTTGPQSAPWARNRTATESGRGLCWRRAGGRR